MWTIDLFSAPSLTDTSGLVYLLEEVVQVKCSESDDAHFFIRTGDSRSGRIAKCLGLHAISPEHACSL
jgi:hypothetical protein